MAKGPMIAVDVHKQPRGNVTDFIKEIDNDYEAARRYYKSREDLIIKNHVAKFKRRTKKTIADVEDALQKQVMQSVNDEFNARLKDIEDGIVLTASGENFLQTTETSKGATVVRMNKNVTWLDIVSLANHLGVAPDDVNAHLKNSSNFYTSIGKIKDEFVSNFINQMVQQGINTGDKAIDNILSSLLGGIQSTGKAVPPPGYGGLKGRTEIGMDVGKGIVNPQDPAHSIDDIEIDGQYYVDINSDESDKAQRAEALDRLLEQYANGSLGGSSAYGIQIKQHRGGEGDGSFRWRDWTYTMEQLNKYQETGQPPKTQEEYKKTWNANYALYFMIAMISKNLVTILGGPQLIGVLLTNDFYFMSQFLDLYNFRYSISGLMFSGSDKDGKKGEIKPKISSKVLYAYKNKFEVDDNGNQVTDINGKRIKIHQQVYALSQNTSYYKFEIAATTNSDKK